MTCRILLRACFDEAWKNHAWLVSKHVYNVVTSPVGHCAPSRSRRCLATNNNIIHSPMWRHIFKGYAEKGGFKKKYLQISFH